MAVTFVGPHYRFCGLSGSSTLLHIVSAEDMIRSLKQGQHPTTLCGQIEEPSFFTVACWEADAICADCLPLFHQRMH